MSMCDMTIFVESFTSRFQNYFEDAVDVEQIFITRIICLSVCEQATGHTFSPRNLIFGLIDPWNEK